MVWVQSELRSESAAVEEIARLSMGGGDSTVEYGALEDVTLKHV